MSFCDQGWNAATIVAKLYQLVCRLNNFYSMHKIIKRWAFVGEFGIVEFSACLNLYLSLERGSAAALLSTFFVINISLKPNARGCVLG